MAARRVACDSLCLLLVGPTWRRLPECTAVSSSLGLAPSSENPRLGPELCVWACRKSSDFLSISEGLRVWGWWWRGAQGGVGSPRLFHGLSPGRQTPRHSVTGGHHSFPPKAPGEPSWVHSGCSRRVWAMAPGMAAPEAGLLLGWLSPSPWGSPHLCPSHPSFWAAEVTGGSVLDLCTQPGSLFSQGSSWTPAPRIPGSQSCFPDKGVTFLEWGLPWLSQPFFRASAPRGCCPRLSSEPAWEGQPFLLPLLLRRLRLCDVKPIGISRTGRLWFFPTQARSRLPVGPPGICPGIFQST